MNDTRGRLFLFVLLTFIVTHALHQTFTNHNSNKVLMSQMTVENAKSLMKVMYNNQITSHPHHIISQSHQVFSDCNRDNHTDHNTDTRTGTSTRDLDQ